MHDTPYAYQSIQFRIIEERYFRTEREILGHKPNFSRQHRQLKDHLRFARTTLEIPGFPELV